MKEMLDGKQRKELEKLSKMVTEEAKRVRQDYKKNPSNESGSYVHIHENSPYLATREERLITIGGEKSSLKPHKKIEKVIKINKKKKK